VVGRNPNAAGRLDVNPLDGDRLRHQSAHGKHALFAGNIEPEGNNELVASDLGDKRILSGCGLYPARHLPYQLVTNTMSQTVVDHLEEVEIEEGDVDPVIFALALASRCSRSRANRSRFGSPVRASCSAK
jgi:hypothetical protein